MCKKLFFSIFVAMVLIGASSAQAVSEPFSVLAFLEQHVTNDTQFGPDQTEDQIGVHIRDIGTNRRRVGFFSFDISSIKIEGAEFANLSFSNLGAGSGPVNVYGVIEEFDNLPPRLELTWNKAPGVKNDPTTAVGDPVELDYDDLTPLLFSFTAPANQVRESTEASQALVDFVNSDTDGIVTLLFAPNVGSSTILRTVRSEEGGIIGGTYLQGEIVTLVELASQPQPEKEAIDVPRDLVLSWTPGEIADKHDIYLGTNFDDVDQAAPTVDLTGVYRGRVDTNFFPDAGTQRLELGQTYYWRVDEVSALPDTTIYKGTVWSFSVESFAYPIPGEKITATASSYEDGKGPENTVNGSGLDENGLLHGNESDNNMWLSSDTETELAWIEYDLGNVYILHELWVWNSNDALETLIGLGFKDVTIEYSVDGIDYTPLGTTPEFAQAPGEPNYAHNTTVNFDGVAAQHVRLTANSNWGEGLLNQYGLSEVRFFSIPMRAWKPGPDDKATDVALNVTLGWMTGREAAEHNGYFSADEQSVIDGTALVDTVSQASYAPLSLDLGSTYFWRIDEVNNAEATTIWQGDTWSFTTSENLAVDDFESYNDIEEGQEGSKLIYNTWTDGFNNPSANGSTIGYVEAFQPSMETDIVHGGNQSVPLTYDNTVASISEITVNTNDLAIGSDWTVGAPEKLLLSVYGGPNNPATERIYVKVNDARVSLDVDLTQAEWQELSVDLDSLGVDLSNVTTLTIGFERIGTTGGSGMVFIDDIQLYAPAILEE